MAMEDTFRCGYVAIIGEPNVGKSTLMNGLLGQKISIVTRKAQTTRHRILGILSTADFQAIFLDTPGLLQPRYALQSAMVESAQSAIADADLILMMIDATRSDGGGKPEEKAVLERVRQSGKPAYCVLNKVDLVAKPILLPMIERYAKEFPFREIFPVSALTLEGTKELLKALAAELPLHPPLYPTDIVSEQSKRFFVAEIIREKVFLRCQEEIPYATSVDIVDFKEREERTDPGKKQKKPVKWFISADLYVERPSQKGILIGKGGSMLKEIGAAARKDIESFLEHPVFLDLHVKVKEKWREDEAMLQRLGYTRK